jgi:glycosyltransferase involved in cell wall biosynthesis
MASRKIIFVNSHPIQYFVPLYKYLNEHGLVTECWYCSDENVRGHVDRQFGARVAWDVPLLEGYEARFFRNYSLRPSLYSGFFGLFNPGMIKALFREPRAIVVVHGWAYLTHILVILFARMAGHTVSLRGESPLNQELMKSKALLSLKRVLFSRILFPLVHFFLYIGKQNLDFYKYYRVEDSKMIFTPYAVDNDRFRKAAKSLNREEARRQLRLPLTGKVILFAAKFIEKKRPLDLLSAYDRVNLSGKCLVMVGEGELRGEMEQFIRERNLQHVYLPGFVNQGEIPKYYSAADVFVLCSGLGETWGLSVNEALNFNLPVVVSSTAGCAADLVVNGENGYVSKDGDVDNLSDCILKAIELEKNFTPDVLNRYSYSQIAQSLELVINKSI